MSQKKTIFVPSLSNTQIKLFSKFIEFRKEKPTEKITVVVLCKEAHVNRSTFYRNYYDIFDFEEKLEDYCVNSVLRFCSQLDFQQVAEEIENENYVPVLPRFDDKITVNAVHTIGKSRNISQKLFDRLLEFFPIFIREDSTKEEITNLKDIFCFIITGAIHFCCEESTSENSTETFYKVALITFYSFKIFLNHFNRHEPFGDLKIMDKEEDLSLPEKKERLNVRKTKRSLRTAFLELLKKRPDEKVSVSELCEKAEVCNSTFYTHYNSIEDYEKSLFNETVSRFFEIAKAIFAHIGEEKIKIKDLLAYFEKTKSFISTITLSKDYEQILNYPKYFASSFFEFIEKDYSCNFDSKIAFSYICYCAWGMLYEPFYEHNLSTTYIFKISYYVFEILFRHKGKDEK